MLLNLLLHLLSLHLSLAFFFPTPQSSSCSCGCPAAPICAPQPTCAVPLPCEQVNFNQNTNNQYVPQYSTAQYTTQSQQYQSPWITMPAQPAAFSVPSPSYTQYVAPAPMYSSAALLPPIAVPPPPPSPSYQSEISSQYTIQPSDYASMSSSPGAAPPIPSNAFLEDGTTEVDATPLPTLIPPQSTEYRDQGVQSILPVYDDTAPALPPPAPSPPSTLYSTRDEVIEQQEVEPSDQFVETPNSERRHNKPTPIPPQALYDQMAAVHSGDTSWNGLSHGNRKMNTEGLSPFEMYQKRFVVLKRMRNSKTMGALRGVPRTMSTCNSNKLANVMVRAMVDDVSVSKRMIMRSTELAFDGARFDVFCATGEFSYSIHSRKYCEVTKDAVTCFAFR